MAFLFCIFFVFFFSLYCCCSSCLSPPFFCGFFFSPGRPVGRSPGQPVNRATGQPPVNRATTPVSRSTGQPGNRGGRGSDRARSAGCPVRSAGRCHTPFATLPGDMKWKEQNRTSNAVMFVWLVALAYQLKISQIGRAGWTRCTCHDLGATPILQHWLMCRLIQANLKPFTGMTCSTHYVWVCTGISVAAQSSCLFVGACMAVMELWMSNLNGFMDISSYGWVQRANQHRWGHSHSAYLCTNPKRPFHGWTSKEAMSLWYWNSSVWQLWGFWMESLPLPQSKEGFCRQFRLQHAWQWDSLTFFMTTGFGWIGHAELICMKLVLRSVLDMFF